MQCHDHRTKIDEYLAGFLTPEEAKVFEKHLAQCRSCRDELASFRELNRMVAEAGPGIPPVDLTKEIMARVKNSSPAKAKRILSLLPDLTAAAAAAIIIFWFSGPVLAKSNVPDYTPGVVHVSSAVGGVFKAYVDFSSGAFNRLSNSVKQISPGHKKGDEAF